MKSFIPNAAASIVQEHKNYRRYVAVLVCLAATVAVGTMLGLRMYGHAMTKEVRVFDCAYEPHQHTEDCYVEIDGEKLLNCGQADYVAHMHNLDCYDEDTGELLCQLPEVKVHAHTDECWQLTNELVCGQEETPAHTHTDACLQEVRTLTCGQEEVPAHTHTDACYAPAEPVLACGLEEHTHTDACYAPAEGDETAEPVLVCGLEEHTHTETCYAPGEPVLTCGLAETEGHTHTEDCYTVTTELACGLEETEGHTHTEDCYAETRTLVCTEPEVILHTHSDECWTPLADLEAMTDDELAAMDLTREDLPALRTRDVTVETDGEPETVTQALTCGQLEVLEHTHTEADGCFHYETVETADDETDAEPETEPELICGLEEHTHTEDCYDEAGELVCGLEEHTHTEDCYAPAEDETETEPELELTCGLEEHTHTDACYDEAGELVCGLEEHTHTEDCYAPAEDEAETETETEPELVLTCGLEEHTHTDACYTDEKVLICELEEGEGHTHNDNCYYIGKVLTCGLEEHTHTEECYGPAEEDLTGSCYDADGNLICDKPEHEHTEDCYAMQEVLTCGFEEGETHTHTDTCYDVNGDLVCTLEENVPHTHTADCYELRRVLVCGLEEHTHTVPEGMVFTASQEVDGMLVTASYGIDARIPADAEFRVKHITPDGEDAEHYDQRMEAAYEAVQNSTEDAIDVTPLVLLNIGFYLNDSEIQPAGPVNVTVQFLDAEESDVPEGASVSVVHFADDDSTEVLTGSDVDAEAATSFDSDSFSDYVISIFDYSNAGNGDNDGIMTIAGGGNTDFEHSKRIDYLGNNYRASNGGPDGDNTDTSADEKEVTDDLYRLYLDMKGESEPVDLLIVIDRSNSMNEKMNGKTRWQTVYDILEGTNNKGTDGLLYQFLKDNKNKPVAERNNVSIVWFAGQFYDRSRSSSYGSATNAVPPNNAKEGGTVFGWTDTYTHRGTSDYSISPYKGVSWGVACTNYVAGLWQADQKLNDSTIKNNNHRKVVVFMSDGVPVYYYMAKDMNWNNPSSMRRYGGGAEDYIFYDFWVKYAGRSNMINNYVRNTLGKNYTVGYNNGGNKSGNKVKSFYDSPYMNETKKIFDAFAARHTDISFHTVAIDLDTTLDGYDRVKLLKDMATVYSGTTYKASNADGLEQYLRSVMFPANVTISDALSANVELLSDCPDIKVTATDKNGKVTKLWDYIGKKVTKDGAISGTTYNVSIDDTNASDIIESVSYTAGTDLTKSTGTISVKFQKKYALSANYTYTLSFNVKLTEAAYDSFALNVNSGGNGYGSVKGAADTDYKGNSKTSSGLPGLNSNSSATVTYYVDDTKSTMQYNHPVVQAWGTYFSVHKKDDKGNALENKKFKLVKGGTTVTTNAGKDGAYYLTDASGNVTWGMLTHGDYKLFELVPDEYENAGEQLVATFTVKKGRITNVQAGTSGIEISGGGFDADHQNSDPNKKYNDTTCQVSVTNVPKNKTVEIYKQDEKNNALAGATFALRKSGDTADTFAGKVSDANGFVWSGPLTEGTYTLTETAAPKDYVKPDNGITFKVTKTGIEIDQSTDPKGLAKAAASTDGKTLRITVKNELAIVDLQAVKVERSDTSNTLAGARFELYHATVNGGAWTRGERIGETVTTLDDGIVGPFTALKQGSYLLVETEAPDGFQLLTEEIRITIEPGADGKLAVTATLGGEEMPVSVVDEGAATLRYTFNVPNDGGYELPRTGGIGTEWYTLGGLLLLAMALAYKAFAEKRRGNV